MNNREFDELEWRKDLEKHLEKNSNSEVLIALDQDDKTIIGMAYFSVQNSSKGIRIGYISNLIVKEEKRRIGIGEEIIRKIIDHSKSNHIHSIRLALRPDIDIGAKKLFIKLGFKNALHIYELQI
ncbi:MAG: GNAT family N-acetyltransferase [Candidatus Lokiarchaeota archaeon]